MKKIILLAILIIILVLAFTPDGVSASKNGLAEHIRNHRSAVADGTFYNPGPNLFTRTYSTDMSMLFDDIQVNPIAGENRFNHRRPFLVNIENDHVMVGWEDNRNGTYDVFGQKVDADGNTPGSNQQLIENPAFVDQFMAQATKSSDGIIALVWVDESGDLYLQYYDSSFTKINYSLKVNDNSSANIVSYPDLAYTSEDRLVVVWEDTRLGSAIYAQIFDSTGARNGGNFKISPTTSGIDYWLPAVACDDVGGFAIIWEEISSTGADVVLRLFNSDGTTAGSSINVADMGGISANQFDPEMIYTSQAGYLVAFSDDRGTDQDIYVQLFDADGNRVDDNFALSEGTDNYAFNVSMVSDSQEKILAVWAELGDRAEITARKLNSKAELDSDDYVISDAFATGERFNPLPVYHADGSALVVFNDSRDMSLQIYAQKLDSNSESTGPNFKLSSTSTGAQMSESDIASLASGDFAAVWKDSRSDDGDIYFQRMNEFGSKLGDAILVNDDGTIAIQNSPAIGSAENGRSAVCWADGRQAEDISGISIFAQRFTSSGSRIGDNIIVNDDLDGTATLHAEPDCDITGDGEMIVVWRDQRDGNDDIYCQTFSTPGFPIGSNFKINQHEYPCYNPRVVSAGNDQFVVAFNSLIDDKTFVFLQVVNIDGGLSGENYIIPVDSSLNQHKDFDLAAHPALEHFVIAWINETEIDTEIHSMMLDLDGNVIESVKIISSQPNLGFDRIRAGMDADGNYAVTWTDQRGYIKRAYQAFVDEAGIIQGNLPVSRYSGDARDEYPAVAVDGKNAVTVWCDNRNLGRGYDVFVNSTVYNPTSADDDSDLPLPTDISLAQNYPNPFNPATTISFSLEREYSNVELDVINMLGQTVNRHTFNNLPAGSHSLEFDASGLSSGVYFYRLSAGNISLTKKMTLLK
ncbi:MAG: T9SS type A sorting domain-containing protein [candidate division Zixibacteria bacterium]|nr:T9SS type A sorting domain-containing protein [candidate division Zixibacteria bacterium]